MAKKPKPQDEDPMEKLMKLTKKLKGKTVAVKTLGPVRTTNKWRTPEPKFEEKKPKSENTVKVGEMDVDPALAQEYENWRKDKEQEQAYRREQFAKRQLIKAKKRFDMRRANSQNPPSSELDKP